MGLSFLDVVALLELSQGVLVHTQSGGARWFPHRPQLFRWGCFCEYAPCRSFVLFCFTPVLARITGVGVMGVVEG